MTMAKTKKDNTKKEVISLYQYHLCQFKGYIAMFISSVFDAMISVFGVQDVLCFKIADKAITLIALMFLAMSAFKDLKCKPEADDELSRLNMSKAREKLSLIFVSFMVLVFVACAFINLFIDIDFMLHITIGFIADFFFILIFAYLSLQSGLFILFEGKEYYCDESEDE